MEAWLANLPDGLVLLIACVTLAALVPLVGLKAGATSLNLKPDAGYKKPMLAFELNAGAASEMFETWNDDTKRVLRTALLWDFLFIFIYPGLIAALCLTGAKYLDAKGFLGFRISLIFIMFALVAALLDAIENCALLALLANYEMDILPVVARWCAIVKFVLVIIAASYALLTCVLALAAWLWPGAAAALQLKFRGSDS
jgi:hypothetical protein